MADESDKPTSTEVDGSEITTNWDECTTTFDSMDLKEDLLRGIYAYGFEKPSAIQQVSGWSLYMFCRLYYNCCIFSAIFSQRAIKPTLMGKDVIAQAQSGKQRHFGLQ